MKKQLGDGGTVVSSSDSTEELRKQFEVQKAELEQDAERLKLKNEEQNEHIERLKEQVKQLEAKETVVVQKDNVVASDAAVCLFIKISQSL